MRMRDVKTQARARRVSKKEGAEEEERRVKKRGGRGQVGGEGNKSCVCLLA